MSLIAFPAFLAFLPAAGPGVADGTIEQVVVGADAGATAQRVTLPVDAVSISQQSELSSSVIAAAEDAARAVNARAAIGRGFSIGMIAVRRGDAIVQQAGGPSGVWQFPMSVTVLPVEAAATVMSAQVGDLLTQGFVVMGATSAMLRGAQAGDIVDLVSVNGTPVSYIVGLVATDAVVGGTEIVMSPAQADALGATRSTRVLIYGQFSRDAIDAELGTRGLIDGTHVRVSRSWNPRNPDSTLGMATTKVLLGEFDYQLTIVSGGGTGVTIDADWTNTHIVRQTFADIPVRASCHVAIIADLQAALSEVYQSGLGGTIDLSNTNTYGGCFNPRFNRVTGSIGFLSRHTWGQPIDMNTVANAQGRTPQMDCRVVRIFRKHKFAWGGNFLVPDGMHFEWVGEPRNTFLYPSKYCPNVPGGAIENASEQLVVHGTERAVIFAADGWTPAHL